MSDTVSFAGKVALVTGSSSGAGAAIALLLALKFRWLFALLGPWGIVAGVGGLPALTFGALWLWL